MTENQIKLGTRHRNTNRWFLFVCILFFILLFAQLSLVAQKAFSDVSKQAGIDHQFKVYEGTFGGGAVVFDLNNDGFEDIFIAGGMAADVLYMNKGNGTFEDIYNRSGLQTSGKYVTQGAVSADINKDGWRDLFIATITVKGKKEKIPRAPNLLYINNGNGTFTDATKEYGLDKLLSFSTAAMFGDVNGDGFPDLYVGNYFQEYQGELNIMNDAMIVGSKQMAKGYLLINKKGKKFVDRYSNYGLTYKGFGFGGVFTDFDNDHDPDLFINHDFGYKSIPNKLLENKYPDDEFEDVSDTMKMNLRINAMGTAVGDYNNDGWLDYFVTNIRANQFMVNQGKGKPFINKSGELGTRFNLIRDSLGKYMPVSWGANFADFDNDSDLDLFVANGCLNPDVAPNPDYYFENVNGHYEYRGEQKGLADRGIGRGSVVFDYDNDGDPDLLVVNQKATSNILHDDIPTRLYRNDSATGNWLKVYLKGVDADFNGIGARVEVVIGKLKLIREIDGGSSHASQNSTIAHFGLGGATQVDSVIVTWTGGKRQIELNQKSNQRLTILEGDNKKWYHKVNWLLILIIPVVLLLAFISRKK